ncbi:signal transduction histidine kinase [Dyadobacter jejuensis]|uniref:histidine kinase n=1 Tax=Dyadobacter jejuensis TaxID=1082580 RepID=A0A316AIJ8_9BACT|nr:hybrid sensor histidine kinase/response regulator transcription factor [Dyadobacter jejuensis]PWJ57605.1 signal transduction histidine kinase [Dyadobacter jejuensis]
MTIQKFITGIVAVILWMNSMAFGQSVDLSNLIMSEENWLPRRSINCIYQDSRGLLWIGAVSGLYRYDGYEVLHFTTQPNNEHAIFTNTVTSIAELRNGDMVIGTESGLSIFDKKTHYFETVSENIESYNALTQDNKGNTWLTVGNNKLLYRLDYNYKIGDKLKPAIGSFAKVFDQIQAINAICSLAPDLLLVGTPKGLFTLTTKGVVKATTITDPVNVIQKSKEGEIMVGTATNGLFELTFDNNTIHTENHYHFGQKGQAGYDNVNSVSFGKNGECVASTLRMIYLSNKNRGVRQFVAYQHEPYLLEDNNILTTYIDDSGIVWLGTLKGLLKIRPKAIKVERLRITAPNYSPINQSVHYLHKDFTNKLWLKTRNDGIFIFDPATKKFTKTDFPSNINTIYQSIGGTAYYATPEGLFQKDGQNYTQVYKGKSDITCAIEIEKGEWILGCQKNGLEYYSSNDSKLYSNLIAKANRLFNLDSFVFVMMKDHSQNVWIGSRGDGLMRMNLTTGEVKKYSGINLKEGVISRRILSLYEDSKGRIWIGTRTGGLYRYIPETDGFKQFTTAHGLPSDVICGIVEDRNNELIISTNNGLAVHIPNEPIPFQSFGVEDGIDFTDFTFNAVSKGANGDVYFGNTNGLYRVGPIPKIKRGKTNFFWNSVQVLGAESTERHRIGEDQKISLPFKDNSFEVKFSYTDLSNPSKNRFAYRLNGLNGEDWVYNNTNVQKIQLLSVPPGEYQLEVKTANSYGQWNDEVVTLAITIAPPFYRSQLAFIFYGLLLLLLIYTALLAYKRWEALNRKLKEEQEYAAIKDQQMVYFSDLSHELKNRLTMILGPLENALSGKKVNQAVLGNLYEQAQRLKRITDQIMNIRKSEAGEFLLKVSVGDLSQKMTAICRDTEPLALITDIKLDYSFDEDLSDAWFDEELVEIMLLNLLNNAIKYNSPGGTVQVRGGLVVLDNSDLPDTAPLPGSYLRCVVEDTGLGIPENEVKHLFERFYRASNSSQLKEGTGIGLELVTRLIQKHKGFMDIKSELNKGTNVTFYIPIEKHHFQINEMKLSVNIMPIIEESPEPKRVDVLNKPAVLIVDDDPDILSLLYQTLYEDFNITQAVNGQEALDLISKNDFELVISDLSMPKLDGLALLRNLKENQQWNHIPFIILTGKNSEFHKLVCIQSGVDDFIDKPFSPKLIKWRAKSLIENRQLLETKFSKKLNLNPEEGLIKSPEEEFLQKVVSLIEEHITDQKLNIEFLAEECSMSRATFYRKMENMIGESPSDFIRTYRLKKATQLLKNTNLYISEVAYQTGFKNPKYFTRIFQKEFGVTPSEYLNNLKNDED